MKIQKIETINETEVCALTESEKIIQQGLSNFIEVGTALLTIRAGRLYRESYATFEEYCRKRWQMGRRYACRLTDSAGVAKNLWPRGHIPTSEFQIRPLTLLPPEKQQEAWAEAIKHHPNPTARQVRTAVQKIAPESVPPAKLRVLKPELTREERCCTLFEVLGPELQQLRDQFSDLPHIHEILGQCVDGLWLCQEDIRERMQLAG